jgi:hypothetical protein
VGGAGVGNGTGVPVGREIQVTEYYTASRTGVDVSYECDVCGEGWTVQYGSVGDIPPVEEIACPTPSDHDDYYCAGDCGCIAEEGCYCCTCGCEEGTRDEACRNVWHEEDNEVVVSPPVSPVPEDKECACPECVKVRDLWKQSILQAAGRLAVRYEAGAIPAGDAPEDKWAHLKPPPT